MAVNFVVQAAVVDLARDIPQPRDEFFVDTNVWVVNAYSRATHPDLRTPPHQLRYSNYLSAVVGAGARLYCCGINFAELCHVIEKSESAIFQATNNVQCSLKEYRHNYPGERIQVEQELSNAWVIVDNMATFIEMDVHAPMISAALANFRAMALDGYDRFINHGLAACGIKQVITDDGDFATVPGIEVYTHNRNVISAAAAQGKLVRR